MTREFWEKLDQYNVYISDVVVEKIEATGDEVKRTNLLNLIKGFEKLSSIEEEIE